MVAAYVLQVKQMMESMNFVVYRVTFRVRDVQESVPEIVYYVLQLKQLGITMQLLMAHVLVNRVIITIIF